LKIIEPKVFSPKQGETYYNYFNDVSFSSIDTSSLPEWNSSKTDYAIEDKVYNPILKRVFVCLKDGTTKEPTVSGDWEDVGIELFMTIERMCKFTERM